MNKHLPILLFAGFTLAAFLMGLITNLRQESFDIQQGVISIAGIIVISLGVIYFLSRKQDKN